MSALHEFQVRFAHALLDPHTALRAQCGPGIAVYQNTVMKGLVDVLRANYPAVARLTGDEWFDAVALQYAREHLPQQPALALYGEHFPDFIRTFPGTEAVPSLPFVAQLDRLWTEVHFAADAAPLKAAQLALLLPEELQSLRVQLHPAARVASVEHSAVTIWRCNRPPAEPVESLQVDDVREAVLLTRPHGAVQVLPLSMAGYALLKHVQSGLTLGEAGMAVLAGDEPVDLSRLLAEVLHAGAFADINADEARSCP